MSTQTRTTRKAPRLEINVTQEIIDGSTRKDSAHCMIAEAVKVAVPSAKNVAVDLATIRFTDRETGQRNIYLTPAQAQAALLAFDAGEKPEPFQIKRVPVAQIVPVRKRTNDPAANRARTKARLERRSQGAAVAGDSDGVPVKVGGQSPPTGPLASGYTGEAAAYAKRTGRIRAFGLRNIVR